MGIGKAKADSVVAESFRWLGNTWDIFCFMSMVLLATPLSHYEVRFHSYLPKDAGTLSSHVLYLYTYSYVYVCISISRDNGIYENISHS